MAAARDASLSRPLSEPDQLAEALVSQLEAARYAAKGITPGEVRLTALAGPFPRVSYAESLERLTAKQFAAPWGTDIGTVTI